MYRAEKQKDKKRIVCFSALSMRAMNVSLGGESETIQVHRLFQCPIHAGDECIFANFQDANKDYVMFQCPIHAGDECIALNVGR